MTEDLTAILRTIREVEDSLERRAARAEGTNVMIWGLVGASIFAFYQLVESDHDTYATALGPWVSWAWLVPMAIGYVASGIVGARLGRMGASAAQRRGYRRGLIPGLLIAALVTVLVLTQRYQFVYGGVTLLAGLACILIAWPAPHGATRTTGLAVGAAMTIVGIALLALWNAPWAAGAAALAFLVGYLTLGTVIYRRGR